MSYSLPLPKYNVIKNINDKLSFVINNLQNDIFVSNGKYSIEELLEVINMQLLKNNDTKNIKFKINYEQKIHLAGDTTTFKRAYTLSFCY